VTSLAGGVRDWQAAGEPFEGIVLALRGPLAAA
jgi:hypothetical protein